MKKGGLLTFTLVTLFFSMSYFVEANIFINEFLPNSVNTDYEWIEIYNDDTLSVNISQYNISEEGASKNFTIKDIIIEPKSFVALVRSDEIFNQTYKIDGIKIIEYGDVVASLNLNDGGDSIFLYDSNGQLIDSIKDYQNPGENVSIGRYPDGASKITELIAQTPGTKNDNSNPVVEWLYPNNNTYVNYLINIVVKITDDAAIIEYAIVDYNGTNYSMSNNGNEWSYLWDANLNLAKPYNITIFFKDSYGKHYSNVIYNITINNTEVISQLNKIPIITFVNLTNTDYLDRANETLKISWLYTDEDNDAITDKEILWYIDGNEDSALRNLTSISSNPRKNQIWTANVRIFDGKNWSEFHNSTALTINNSAPAQSVPLITSNDDKNRKNGTLTCNNNVFDADNDNIVNFVRWYKNNIPIFSTIDSMTLKPGNYSKNDNIMCEIIPSDKFLNGTPLNSSAFKILNTAPVFVSEIQNKVWNQDTSTIINLINAFMDLDGDELTYAYTPIFNITVSIDNNKKIATLTPDKGFNGTKTIVFTASDKTDSTKSNEIILTVNSVYAGTKENKKIVDEKTNNQETLNENLKEESTIQAESEEPIVITGKAIDSKTAKDKKTNYIYFIILTSIVLITGIYFIAKKLLKRKEY